jgi:hypothetical protein
MTVGQVTVDQAIVDSNTPSGAAYYLRSLKDIRGLVNGIDSGSGDDTRGLVAVLITVLDALRNVEGFVVREDEITMSDIAQWDNEFSVDVAGIKEQLSAVWPLHAPMFSPNDTLADGISLGFYCVHEWLSRRFPGYPGANPADLNMEAPEETGEELTTEEGSVDPLMGLFSRLTDLSEIPGVSFKFVPEGEGLYVRVLFAGEPSLADVSAVAELVDGKLVAADSTICIQFAPF